MLFALIQPYIMFGSVLLPETLVRWSPATTFCAIEKFVMLSMLRGGISRMILCDHPLGLFCCRAAM